jgi:magnesium chelatase family protein
MGPVEVQRFCLEALADEARPVIASATERLGLSARSFHRVLKVSRTIADLDGCEVIGTGHVAEAIQYRRRGSD